MYRLVEILTLDDEFACYLFVPLDSDLNLFLDRLVGDFYQTLDYKIGHILDINPIKTSLEIE